MENQLNNGYEDIDRLVEKQDKMLNNSLEQQNALVDKSTQMSVDRLNKNKADLDKETEKTNKGLYQEYMKAQNPYGYNAEALASAGLGRSGYAESTQAKMYNTYQNNITETMNNAKNLKANFDFEINQAMQSGDLAKAENAYNMYNQKMQLLAQEYQLRNNREQFLYQKEQDALAQSNWEKQYDYQKSRDQVSDDRYTQEWAYQKERDAIADDRYLSEKERQERLDALDEQWRQKQFDYQTNMDAQKWEYQKERDAIADDRYISEQERQRRLDELDEKWRQTQFEYQKNRDAVSDSQWEREYELQKKTAEEARSRSYSSGSSSGGNSGENTISLESNSGENSQTTPQQLLAGIKMVQGPGVAKPIYDSNSGKYFSSIEEMLNYHGFGSMD